MGKIRFRGTFRRYDEHTPEELRADSKLLPGYQEITFHMVFDIKMDGKFTRKARYVANGAKTKDVPAHDTYASVVSRESVRLAFLHAALNGLDVLSCDVSNAYLNAPCKERIWIEAGPEFGSDNGSVQIVERAAYGLKSSGNWLEHRSNSTDGIPIIVGPDRSTIDIVVDDRTERSIRLRMGLSVG